jgi:hypothetical protein
MTARTRKSEQSKLDEANVVKIAEHRGDTSQEKPPLSEVVAAAENLPNIDGRASVLANLPKEVYVEGRIDFAEEEEDSVPGVRFGQPRQMDYVRCDPAWGKLLHCVKNPKNGALYPATAAILKKHPEIAAAAKLYVVRLAVVDDNDEVLFWAVPHPTSSSTPGDQVWRQAQTASLTQWTKTWWDGHARHYTHPKEPEKFSEPAFPTQDYDTLLQTAIADELMWRADHHYAQKLLR